MESETDVVVSSSSAGIAAGTTTTANPAAGVVVVDNDTTTVDGQGMWRSWTRVFAKPESACLDLLDNCFDAALKPEHNFHGKVSLQSSSSFLFLRNNSLKPIKSLEDALTVYKSSKNAELIHNRLDGPSSLFGRSGGGDGPTASSTNDSNNNNDHSIPTTHRTVHQNVSSNCGSIRTEDDPASRKDAIGENGVGLKHGCATLSDCSVIVTRNKDVIEIGFICRQLQTPYGVNLPSFTFKVPSQATAESLKAPITQWLQSHNNVQDAVEAALQSDIKYKNRTVADLLTEWVQSFWSDGYWKDEDHIFLLVLFNLKKRAAKKADGVIFHSLIPLTEMNAPSVAEAFLKQIRTMLPEYYINLPSYGQFDFLIDEERVDFSYWQRRLVELTKFHVHVPLSTPFESLPDNVWMQGGEEQYPLKLYCGFDAQRVSNDASQGIGTSPLRLYIYSCQAGRLIQMETDARFMLGMSTSGVDYCQGLTVIVNDTDGKLPLTPTKDGIAWSERPHGDIHRQNLHAWAGAVAQLYWQYHRGKFIARGGNFSKALKEYMKKTIQSFAKIQDEYDYSAKKLGAIEEGAFTEWTDIPWRRVKPTYGTLWTIRKQQKKHFYITTPPGVDTLFLFSQALAKPKKKAPLKRKASSMSATSSDGNRVDGENIAKMGSVDENENSSEDNQDSDNETSPSGRSRRRRKKRINYNTLENKYSSLHFERPIKTKPTLTKGGRPINKASMQALEDQLEIENLRRLEAEADRDAYKSRIKELQKQLSAQNRRIRALGGTAISGVDAPDPSAAVLSDTTSTMNGSTPDDDTALPSSSSERLETTDEKEARLSVGDIVYCQWPETLLYYWATVIKVVKPTSARTNFEYNVQYEDGDVDTVTAAMIHSHDEAVRLMNEGRILKNFPQSDWLESVISNDSNNDDPNLDPESQYQPQHDNSSSNNNDESGSNSRLEAVL